MCPLAGSGLLGQGLPLLLLQVERLKYNKKQMTIQNLLFMSSLWWGDVEGRGPVQFIQPLGAPLRISLP